MPERDLNQMLARLRLLEREYPKLQAERDELRQRCDRLTEEVTNQRALLQAERRKSAELQAARRERDEAQRAMALACKFLEQQIKDMQELLREAQGYVAEAIEARPHHTCGPESQCDCDCVRSAYASQLYARIQKALGRRVVTLE